MRESLSAGRRSAPKGSAGQSLRPGPGRPRPRRRPLARCPPRRPRLGRGGRLKRRRAAAPGPAPLPWRPSPSSASPLSPRAGRPWTGCSARIHRAGLGPGRPGLGLSHRAGERQRPYHAAYSAWLSVAARLPCPSLRSHRRKGRDRRRQAGLPSLGAWPAQRGLQPEVGRPGRAGPERCPGTRQTSWLEPASDRPRLLIPRPALPRPSSNRPAPWPSWSRARAPTRLDRLLDEASGRALGGLEPLPELARRPGAVAAWPGRSLAGLGPPRRPGPAPALGLELAGGPSARTLLGPAPFGARAPTPEALMLAFFLEELARVAERRMRKAVLTSAIPIAVHRRGECLQPLLLALATTLVFLALGWTEGNRYQSPMSSRRLLLAFPVSALRSSEARPSPRLAIWAFIALVLSPPLALSSIAWGLSPPRPSGLPALAWIVCYLRRSLLGFFSSLLFDSRTASRRTDPPRLARLILGRQGPLALESLRRGLGHTEGRGRRHPLPGHGRDGPRHDGDLRRLRPGPRAPEEGQPWLIPSSPPSRSRARGSTPR